MPGGGRRSRGKAGTGRADRLAGEAAFREVISAGRRWNSPELVLFRLDGKAGAGRLGVVVGRKLGGAVPRNLFKRRVREALRIHPAFADGTFLVVVAKPGALGLSYAGIADRLDRALKATEG